MICCPPPVAPQEVDTSPLVEEVVGKTTDVPPGTKKTFEVRGRKILVINDNNQLFAINGVCSHYNFPLESGTYAKGRIRCPLHGACFNVRTGDIEDYPGFDSLHTFRVLDVDGDLVIRATEKLLESDRRIRIPPPMKKCDDIPIVVIGSGPAAATFIEHSRLNGLVTPIVVITEESILPYDRVMLSKRPSGSGSDFRLRKDDFYESRRVVFRTSTKVTSVAPKKRELSLANGEKLRYSKLVVASGASVRKLAVPGSNLNNVFYLRTIEEANAIAHAAVGKHVVCVGASFIGLEVGSALKESAASVTIVANSEEPLPVFGADIGRGIRKKFEDRGVKFHTKATVVALEGEDVVQAVVLNDGVVVPADVVIAGIGVLPTTEFLKGSGIELDKRGHVLVDSHFRTNEDYVYAIGDVVSFPLPLWDIDTLNIQHFQTAQAHGQMLGYSIVGKPQPGPIVPYFWSLFFFAFGVRFAGCSVGSDSQLTHGDPEGEFVRYYLKNDKVVALVTLGTSTAAPTFAEIFKRRIPVTRSDVEKNPSDSWTHLLQ